jgi:hypothetical protein
LSIHWQAVCPTTQQGGLIAAYDIDVEDTYTTGTNLPKQLMANDRSRMWRVIDHQDVRLRTKLKGDPFRFLDPISEDDPRWEQQATFWMASTTAIPAGAGSTSVPLGELWVSYDIEFQGSAATISSAPGTSSPMAKFTAGGTKNGTRWFGTTPTTDPNDTADWLMNYSASSENYVTGSFPAGTYLFYIMSTNTASITAGGQTLSMDTTTYPSTGTWTLTQIQQAFFSTTQISVLWSLSVPAATAGLGKINLTSSITSGGLVSSIGYLFMLPLGVTHTKKTARQEKHLLEDDNFIRMLSERLKIIQLEDAEDQFEQIRGDNNRQTPIADVRSGSRSGTHTPRHFI